MNTRRLESFALMGLIAVIGSSLAFKPDAADQLAEAEKNRLSIESARVRAATMHEVFADSLEVVHHHYFRQERATLPARAFEDVFDLLEERSDLKARWISVNAPPMSIDHEPSTSFEKEAARALASGKPEYSQVADGRLLWAGPILLGSNCIGCHTPASPAVDKVQRLAGLVISVPVKEESPK